MTNSLEDLQLRLDSAQEALRIADERAVAGRLALEVMHDIRNPLEAVRNLNYLTTMAAGNAEDVRKLTLLAEEQLEIVIDIANSTLGFVRPASHLKSFNLVSLVEAGIRIHQRTIERKSIHLVKDFRGDATAPIYPGEMLQVISNLLTNALDALPAHGKLYLRVRKRKHSVQMLVADSGQGIPAAHVSQIFKPFFTTKEDEGTGLGLALIRKIVDRHRGTIRLRSSVSPGSSGTVFRISLPLASEHAARKASPVDS